MSETKLQQMNRVAASKAKKAKEEEDEKTLDIDSVPHEEVAPVFSIGSAPEGSIPPPKKQSPIDRLKEKTGVGKKAEETTKPKADIHSALSENQKAFVRQASDIFAKVISGVMVWIFTIPGPEYSALAPSEIEMLAICEPLLRIYARHNKLVKEYSPDYVDASAAIAALMAYAHVSFMVMSAIRDDKERNNGISTVQFERPTSKGDNARRNERKTQSSNGAVGYSSVRGDTADASVYAVNGRDTSSELTADLTDEQRYQYERLRELSRKDFEARARRSGRL